MYTVHEIFYTLQGEGHQTGRAAVFCRFSGCNLWSGREQDRSRAICQFCDTNFVGVSEDGGKFPSAQTLAQHIAYTWRGQGGRPLVVFTGGEPLLQLDPPLIHAMHALNFEIAVESNGTIAAPDGIDWLCISPKAGSQLIQTSGHELKLVWPQLGFHSPSEFEALDFQHFFLQPLDNGTQTPVADAISWCLHHPRWQLSLQTHKLTGIR